MKHLPTETEYNAENNTATLYVNGYAVGSLDFNNDEFEQLDETDWTENEMCEEMENAKAEYLEAVDCLRYETNY